MAIQIGAGARREQLAERVDSAAYGTVLVLSTLAVVKVADVSSGHAVELVVGVGLATWLAHLFAELLAEHIRRDEPLAVAQVRQAAADGFPILASTAAPAVPLLLGLLDVLDDDTARTVAILVAIGQLSLIGAIVGHLSPATTRSAWGFAGVVAIAGIVVVVLEVALSH